MTIIDRIFLLLTGLAAIHLLWHFAKKEKKAEIFYYMISFAVLLVAGLLLIFFGWAALGNKFVAIVAALIPFGIAAGLVARFFPKAVKGYLFLLIIGLILIVINRLGIVSLGKIVYPLFHAIAGLTIFFVPLYAVKNGKAKSSFAFVTLGGTLIGLGGIALAFITVGKQLLFFSPTFVMAILAPLLFFTTLFFAIGLVKGE